MSLDRGKTFEQVDFFTVHLNPNKTKNSLNSHQRECNRTWLTWKTTIKQLT